jgi:transposase
MKTDNTLPDTELKTCNKVLKLNSADHRFEWTLFNTKTGEKIIISPADIVYFLRVFTGAVAKGYMMSIPKIYDPVQRKLLVFSKEAIAETIRKNIPETEFKIADKTLCLLSDNIGTSISYQLAKNIFKNFKDGMPTAIRTLPYLTRFRDDKSNPYDKSFKSNINEFKLTPEDDKSIAVSIVYRAFKDNWFIGVKFKLKLAGRDFKEENSYYQILKRIDSKNYKITSIGLSVKPKAMSYVKNKQKSGLSMLISYKFEKEEIKTKDNIMGITIGQRHIAAFSVIDPFNGKRVESGCINPPFDWKGQLVRLKKEKSNIQSMFHIYKNYGGDLAKLKISLNRLRHKEKNFMLTIYKPSIIIGIAKKLNVSLIRLENLDLDQNDVNKLKIKKYNYRTAQKYIASLAEKAGIKVEYVDAAGSVMRCSQCGYVGITKRTNRIKPDVFMCKECGFTEEPDINQSHNIALNAGVMIKEYVINELKEKFKYSPDEDTSLEKLIAIRANFYNTTDLASKVSKNLATSTQHAARSGY